LALLTLECQLATLGHRRHGSSDEIPINTQGGYMNVPIKPLSGHVVLTQKEQNSTTKSGILLTDAAKEKTEARVVAAVADDVKTLKAGDEVICKSYAGTNVAIEKTEYTIIKAEDILGVLIRSK
jgi:chaperonin GroES